MRWTWRKFGCVGSAATRERCLTVSPRWASPSTPNPAKSRISLCRGLPNVCLGLLLTASTRAFSIAIRSALLTMAFGLIARPSFGLGQTRPAGKWQLARVNESRAKRWTIGHRQPLKACPGARAGDGLLRLRYRTASRAPQYLSNDADRTTYMPASLPVSILDLVVIGVVLISALLAAVRGFTREVLAIVAWVTAAAVAWFLHPLILPRIKDHISNPTLALAAAIGAIFAVTLLIVSIITVKFSDFVLDSRIGALDRTLGFVFGAARGLLICVVGWVFLSWLVQGKMP